MFSATFAGIAPSSVPSFIGAQIIGGALAIGIIKALYPAITPADAAGIIVPHTALPAPGQPRTAHRRPRTGRPVRSGRTDEATRGSLPCTWS